MSCRSFLSVPLYPVLYPVARATWTCNGARNDPKGRGEMAHGKSQETKQNRKRPVKAVGSSRGVWGRMRRGAWLSGGLGLGLPVVREEFVDAAIGMGGDAGEEVAQVGEGVEAVAPGAGNEAEVDGGGVSTAVGAEEQPVLAAQGDGAHGLFGRVVVDVEAGVGGVAAKGIPVAQRVVDGAAHGALGQDFGFGGPEPLGKGIE